MNEIRLKISHIENVIQISIISFVKLSIGNMKAYYSH